MKKYLSCKGQSLVEFALILAFIASVCYYANSGGLFTATKGLIPPTAHALADISRYADYDVTNSIQNIIAIQKRFMKGNTTNKADYRRGMVRSEWLSEEDSSEQYIKELYDETGARKWTYLNGQTNNYRNTVEGNGLYRGDIGLYWTTHLVSMDDLTINSKVEKDNYSLEHILQYFYCESNKRYYVILNRVWVNQGDVASKVGLAGLHKEWNKPTGYIVGSSNGYATLAEAKEIFEGVRKTNEGRVVFSSLSELLEEGILTLAS